MVNCEVNASIPRGSPAPRKPTPCPRPFSSKASLVKRLARLFLGSTTSMSSPTDCNAIVRAGCPNSQRNDPGALNQSFPSISMGRFSERSSRVCVKSIATAFAPACFVSQRFTKSISGSAARAPLTRRNGRRRTSRINFMGICQRHSQGVSLLGQRCLSLAQRSAKCQCYPQ